MPALKLFQLASPAKFGERIRLAHRRHLCMRAQEKSEESGAGVALSRYVEELRTHYRQRSDLMPAPPSPPVPPRGSIHLMRLSLRQSSGGSPGSSAHQDGPHGI